MKEKSLIERDTLYFFLQ